MALENRREILLSVCILTYNHEKYISDTINGVLNQQHDYSWEFIIADDLSTDKTRDRVVEYKKKYPFINFIMQPVNKGATGNFIDLFKAAKGKYIAFCEGDDYWTDPFKLQKQINFLESNVDYSICFHSVLILKEGQKKKRSELNPITTEQTYTVQDLAKKNIIHTPSVVYRNVLNGKLPIWFADSPIGDYVLHMLHAKHGKIKYLPEPMAIYRIHAGGTFSNLKQREILLKSIKVNAFLRTENFDSETIGLLNEQSSKLVNELLELNLKTNWSLEQFLSDLSYTAGDEELRNRWLTKRLPEEINDLRNSGSFRLGQKLSKIFKFATFGLIR